MRYKISNVYLALDKDEAILLDLVKRKVGTSVSNLAIERKSLDARKGKISYVYSLSFTCEKKLKEDNNLSIYKDSEPYIIPKVDSDIRPVIIGFGPSGIFASLYLARANLKPIIIEQGKDIDNRIIDVENMKDKAIFNPKSNVVFGEGGAGTFSDGKLNTGIKDERIKFCLNEFYIHGGKKELTYDSKPHVGTDMLRGIIKNIRQEIISLGGEIRFETKLVDFVIEDSKITKLILKSNGVETTLEASYVILAIGHSAHETYKMLFDKGVALRPKPFSIGVRIEHKQVELNKSQYKSDYLNPKLPPADYKLVAHLSNNRSLYSFCMCPGGEVVASNSEVDSIVTNGMSNSKRDGENSNSALLVNVNVEDYYKGSPLDGIDYIKKFEKLAFSPITPYYAPIQLLGDFLAKRKSSEIKSVLPTYKPGTYFINLWDILPSYVCDSLKEGIPLLANKISCFKNMDAVLTGVETRSSSPLIIERDLDLKASVTNLYPCGEGSGYAGGIMSSSVDGLKVAEKVLKEIVRNGTK